jgi:hypothetical protein
MSKIYLKYYHNLISHKINNNKINTIYKKINILQFNWHLANFNLIF